MDGLSVFFYWHLFCTMWQFRKVPRAFGGLRCCGQIYKPQVFVQCRNIYLPVSTAGTSPSDGELFEELTVLQRILGKTDSQFCP